MARLDEICSLNMGQSPDSLSYNEIGDGLPFFQGNADFGVLHPNVRIWCNAPTKIAHPGDILISVRAPIGALNIADRECCIGRGLAALTVNQTLCNSGYLWYAIANKVDELNSKGTGSTFKAISKNVLGGTEIPLPSLDQQQRVSSVLDKLTSLISLRKQQLAKLDELVKARFVEMFGDPLSESTCWPNKCITDVCPLICGGGTPSKSHPEYFTGNIPWVSPKDMKSLSIEDSIDHITEDAVKKSTTNLIPARSVLMVIRSGILKHSLPVAINTVPVTINQDMKAFVPGADITSEYLMHYFLAIEADVLAGVRGVTADNIDFKSFLKRSICVPSIELQKKFTNFVEQTNYIRLTARQGLDKLEVLKKSLMQEYFG